MAKVNLLRSLPQGKRNITSRAIAKTEENIRLSKEFGEMYFDGPRELGYGGYRYDGRWKPVAQDIIDHFGLKPGDRFLDIGCAKGFLVKDMLALGIDAYGLDISLYALMNCEPEVVGRLQIGNAISLPFPDKSFQAATSINTIHNLSQELCLTAISEMERIAPGKGFIQVDSYNSPEEKKIFESWVLTAEYHDYPWEWEKLFKSANFTGDWFWTIL
jgi:ubiquinone/menaquinone biosynthesis C-methylase UbiE